MTSAWSRWWSAAFIAAFLIVTAVSGLFYCALPPSPDQSIFDYIGFIGSRGGAYYRDAFDISWPAPFLYHEAGIRLFGVHSWTSRLTDFCMLPIGLAGLWLLIRAAGYPRAALAAVLLYPPYYVTSGGWMAGHRDIVGMHALLLAAGLLVTPTRHRLCMRLAVGALVGFTTMIRPTYLFAALPFWLIEMRALTEWRDRLIATAQFAIGLALAILPFVIVGAIEGTIGDWYEQAVLLPTTVYQLPESRLRLIARLVPIFRENLLWPGVAGALGFGLWAWTIIVRRQAATTLAAYAGLIATALVSYFVQNKGFGYHLGGLVPLAMIPICIGGEAGLRVTRKPTAFAEWVALLLVALTLLIAAAGLLSRARHNFRPAAALLAHADFVGVPAYLYKRAPGPGTARLEAADVVRAATKADDRVLQWGWNYEIPYLAERLPTTHLLNTNLVGGIRDRDVRLKRWLVTLAGELKRDRAALIIVDLDVEPRGLFPPGARSVADRPPSTRILTALTKQGYHPIFDKDQILILKRD